METLFLSSDLMRAIWFLKDAKGALIGRFDYADDAREWAKQNNYRCRDDF